MNDHPATGKISLSVEDEEFKERKIKSLNNNLERVKDKLREVFPPENYERLITYAAKLYIEGHLMDKERQEFIDAMLSIEFARAEFNKDAERIIKENFNNNCLLQKVIHLEKYSAKFLPWDMQRKRHGHDRKAKRLVKDWWKSDKEKGLIKDDVIENYQQKLFDLGIYPIGNNKSKQEERYDDEDKKYADTTISKWMIN